MISFRVSGKVPAVLPQSTLHRLSRAMRGVKGLPRDAGCEVGVRFVTEKEIEKLNKTYRGKGCSTDVLSFVAGGRAAGRPGGRRRGGKKIGWPRVGREGCELGDIVICSRVAAREAKRRSVDVKEEYVRLLVHGVLHLAGMDHEKPAEEKRMFRLQETVVEKVDVRASGRRGVRA
jgi:probable rRNA maturation factor